VFTSSRRPRRLQFQQTCTSCPQRWASTRSGSSGRGGRSHDRRSVRSGIDHDARWRSGQSQARGVRQHLAFFPERERLQGGEKELPFDLESLKEDSHRASQIELRCRGAASLLHVGSRRKAWAALLRRKVHEAIPIRLWRPGSSGHLGVPSSAPAADSVQDGQWRYLGGDAGHTRSHSLNQINASNFSKLKVAWIFRGDNFGPGIEFTARSRPVFVNGVLYTVVGQPSAGRRDRRRHGRDALDLPGARDRAGLALAEDGLRKGRCLRGGGWTGRDLHLVPRLLLWALDARTGRPLENWGTPVRLKIPQSGVIDMIPDLVRDWEPWLTWKGGITTRITGFPGSLARSRPRHTDRGKRSGRRAHLPRASYDQTRLENVPGDIQGLRRKIGKAPLEFHVIPRPGEFARDLASDAWNGRGTGVLGPASADRSAGSSTSC